MNFGLVELTPRQAVFADDVRAFVREHVDDEVRTRERATGAAFSESAYLALGGRGWIMPGWPRDEGGAELGPIEMRILELELARAQFPWVVASMTRRIWRVLERYLEEPLKSELKPQVAAGRVRFCLGYTEPEGGSDIAGARLSAVRDGASGTWLLNGVKSQITGVRDCQYMFVLSRTDLAAPKHRGMTTFLVSLDLPGITIADTRTFGGERTSTVTFTGVRVPDTLRLGQMNAGWAVVRAPLDEEHGIDMTVTGLQDPSVGRTYIRPLERALDAAIAWAAAPGEESNSRPLDSEGVRLRLARVAVQLETAMGAPGPMGRVKGSDVARAGAAELADLVGTRAIIRDSGDGCVAGGEIEFAYRFAHGASLYGGTPEIYRNMIAQSVLGLPRPWFPGSRTFVPDESALTSGVSGRAETTP